MDIYLDDKTSLIMMRVVARDPSLSLEPTDKLCPTRLDLSPVKLSRLGIGGLLSYLQVPESNALGIAVPRKEDRVRTRGITNQIIKAPRGSNPFLLLAHNEVPSYVDAPWGENQVFVQSAPNVVLGMARRLRRRMLSKRMDHTQALLLLVKLCLELCGTYAHDPFAPNTGDVAYEVQPQTTAAELVQAFEPAGTEQGLALAREAAALTYDRSGSPQESFLGPALFFPSRLGGLELGEFVANEQLDLSPERHAMIGQRVITPDFQMVRYCLAIEYKGKVHETGDNPKIDHVRSLDYQTLGTRELSLVYEDVSTKEAFMRTASRIVSIMEQFDGPDVRKRYLALSRDKDFRDRQRTLFKVFRPWLR